MARRPLQRRWATLGLALGLSGCLLLGGQTGEDTSVSDCFEPIDYGPVELSPLGETPAAAVARLGRAYPLVLSTEPDFWALAGVEAPAGSPSVELEITGPLGDSAYGGNCDPRLTVPVRIRILVAVSEDGAGGAGGGGGAPVAGAAGGGGVAASRPLVFEGDGSLVLSEEDPGAALQGSLVGAGRTLVLNATEAGAGWSGTLSYGGAPVARFAP